MAVEIRVERGGAVWIVSVAVAQRGKRTEHRVTVSAADLERYGASDPADLVRRAFAFLLERESSTSILREFRITEIERYFPEFREAIQSSA